MDTAALSPSPTGRLESLLSRALAALDRGGDVALHALLAQHPAERADVLELVGLAPLLASEVRRLRQPGQSVAPLRRRGLDSFSRS